MFILILFIILSIIIFGVKYWLIGAVLAVFLCIGGFIKISRDEKKAHEEYLEAMERLKNRKYESNS